LLLTGDITVRFYDSKWQQRVAVTKEDIHKNVSRRLIRSY